mgnify:CR=1 FL=1
MKDKKKYIPDTMVNNWQWSRYPWYYVKAMFDIVVDWIIKLWVRPNDWKFDDYEEKQIEYIRFHEHEYKYYDNERPFEYKYMRAKQHAPE